MCGVEPVALGASQVVTFAAEKRFECQQTEAWCLHCDEGRNEYDMAVEGLGVQTDAQEGRDSREGGTGGNPRDRRNDR